MRREKEHDRAVFTWREKADIRKACNGICTHCGKILTDDFTVEHVIPISKGGDNNPNNLVALCEKCNKKKSDQIVTPKEYYRYLPKKRRKALQADFEKYCEERDWLTEFNLFTTDQFKIKAEYREITKLGLSIMPTVYQVSRMSRQETLAFMHAYAAKNGWNTATPAVMDEIKQNYYKVTHNGNILYIFTGRVLDLAEAEKETLKLTGDPNEEPEIRELIKTSIINRYYICIDILTHPDITYKGSTTMHTIQFTMSKIFEQIRKTMCRNQKDACVRVTISAPRTDIAGQHGIPENIRDYDIWVLNAINRPKHKFATNIQHVTSQEEINRRTETLRHAALMVMSGKLSREEAIKQVMKANNKQDLKTSARLNN